MELRSSSASERGNNVGMVGGEEGLKEEETDDSQRVSTCFQIVLSETDQKTTNSDSKGHQSHVNICILKQSYTGIQEKIKFILFCKAHHTCYIAHF